ncbi:MULTISPECIES: hypothetical protein [unclassified Streptomyces]|uniref:hypothetical protein n=1 Tax=unclassified Streptomyces TaxID=2593676 RepID=UPI0036E5DE46
MDVVEQIEAELEDLHAHETSPGMAAVALDLARAMAASDAPTAKAVCAEKLRTIMSDLRKLAPAETKGDGVDGIVGNRAERKARLHAVPASGE